MKKLIILSIAFLLAGASPEDARKANEAYRSGEYEKAVTLYRKAIDDRPENARLYFNLGNALAKSGKTEEAVKVFEQYKSMADDPENRALADYNIGNIYSENKKWDRALDHYRSALRYRKGDEDAKHNYELARRQRQDQNQDQQQQQQNQQDQNQQQDQQQQQQQNQDQDQQQQDQQQDQQQQQDQDRQQQNRQQQQINQISKAEAEKILQALEQREKELLKEFKKQKTESSNSTNEKDW